MSSQLSKIKLLRKLFIDPLARNPHDEAEKIYADLRKKLIRDAELREHLPGFIKKYDTFSLANKALKEAFDKPIEHFRGHRNYSTYQRKQRKAKQKFIIDQFSQTIIYLDVHENTSSYPLDTPVLDNIQEYNSESINSIWHKALERRKEDPEAAITIAKTLLESVCKHILEESGISHNNDDLPKLYKKTAEQLNMAPTQHQEKIFKQILQGCYGVVQGLGTLRNQLGDAHGKGKVAAKPSARHAELSVNLAGSMSSFLIATWQEKVEKERTILGEELEF